MITDKDITRLKQVFATKDDLSQLRNDIIIFKDQILGEIVKLREESVMDLGLRDQVEDHDLRLEKIEKHLNIAA